MCWWELVCPLPALYDILIYSVVWYNIFCYHLKPTGMKMSMTETVEPMLRTVNTATPLQAAWPYYNVCTAADVDWRHCNNCRVGQEKDRIFMRLSAVLVKRVIWDDHIPYVSRPSRKLPCLLSRYKIVKMANWYCIRSQIRFSYHFFLVVLSQLLENALNMK